MERDYGHTNRISIGIPAEWVISLMETGSIPPSARAQFMRRMLAHAETIHACSPISGEAPPSPEAHVSDHCDNRLSAARLEIARGQDGDLQAAVIAAGEALLLACRRLKGNDAEGGRLAASLIDKALRDSSGDAGDGAGGAGDAGNAPLAPYRSQADLLIAAFGIDINDFLSEGIPGVSDARLHRIIIEGERPSDTEARLIAFRLGSPGCADRLQWTPPPQPDRLIWTTKYGTLWHRNRSCQALHSALHIMKREACVTCAPCVAVGVAGTPPEPKTD
jgi:hypothetical protein